MNCKLPRPARACCCLPLRRCIILFVYLNLVLSISENIGFLLSDFYRYLIKLFMHTNKENELSRMGRSKINEITTLLMIFGGTLSEICMSIVALVGLHKKTIKLIRAYLYYATVYTALVISIRALSFNLEYTFLIVELPTLAAFTVMKVYYLLLIRSQLKKMEQQEKEERSLVEMLEVHDVEAKKTDCKGQAEYADLDEYENF